MGDAPNHDAHSIHHEDTPGKERPDPKNDLEEDFLPAKFASGFLGVHVNLRM